MTDDADEQSRTDADSAPADHSPPPVDVETGMPPPADNCLLCGDGYYPNLEIKIVDTPKKREYRWGHIQYHLDHGEVFLETFKDTPLRFDE